MASNSFMIFFIYYLLSGFHLTCGYKASIQAIPSTVIKNGGNVTIQCSSDYGVEIFRLYRRKNGEKYEDGKGDGEVGNFTLTNVNDADGADYSCEIYVQQVKWSERSSYLQLKILNARSPDISSACWEEDEVHKRTFIINCTAPAHDLPEEVTVIRFHLYSNRNHVTDLNTEAGSLQVTFRYKFPSDTSNANFSCSYVLEVKETPTHQITSQHSKSVQPQQCDRKSAHDETTPIISPETSARDKTAPSISPVLLVPVISSLCGVLVLVLLVIILVYVKRKNKPSEQKKKNGEFPPSIKVEGTNEATYSSIEESKNNVTPNVEVNMQGTNVDDDGITYATLNNAALNKKTASNTPDDTSLYAEVKKPNKRN
ncbi:uncharacterized protein LOC142107973 [Mixophyes fleayi]|uniref:uncharacterized protein LOC142107973 n=1 Tax=Mixophyes fleayi TaxID=3061075 RepID=UPI003F4DA68A